MLGAFDVIGRLKRDFERGWEAGRCRRDSVRRRPPHLPHLEALEERRVPSGYRIVNLGSFGGTKAGSASPPSRSTTRACRSRRNASINCLRAVASTSQAVRRSCGLSRPRAISGDPG